MWGWVKSIGRGLSGFLETVIGVGWWGIHRFLGIPELIGSLLGLRVTKYLRIKVIILKSASGQPVADEAAVQIVVQEANERFQRSMNVHLLTAGPGSRMFEVYDEQNPSYVLTPKCDEGGVKHWFTRMGRWYRRATAPYTRRGGIVIWVVEDVQRKSGCFMFDADYGHIDPTALRDRTSGKPVEGGKRLTLAHEVGHANDLRHRDDPQNLMNPSSAQRTGRLTRWQRSVFRSSQHVRYW